MSEILASFAEKRALKLSNEEELTINVNLMTLLLWG